MNRNNAIEDKKSTIESNAPNETLEEPGSSDEETALFKLNPKRLKNMLAKAEIGDNGEPLSID